MPELPEVEIWRGNLERWLAGRRILGARVPDPILRGRQSRRAVESGLEGAVVGSVDRRGKFLLLGLGRRRAELLIHLGMTGAFERVEAGEKPPRFTRAELRLARGERVAFTDARRLGEFRLVGAPERARLDKLGIEPLDRGFTAARLYDLTRASRRPVKLFLMDQHRVAGLGNIHAAEALFLAGVHPERPARSLSREECARLARAIRRELRGEIRRSSIGTLRYLQQGAENRFQIYGHYREPCPRCTSPVEKLVQGGRTTYYCPRCQPEGRYDRRDP